MPTGSFYVRIGVRDTETAKAALRSFGAEGEKTLQRFEKATQRPTRAMLSLNQATRGVGDELRIMASNAGPAGQALAALGRGGLAAAAGIGAIVLGGRELLRVAEQVTELENRLRLVTSSSEELESTQRALADIAQNYGSDLSSLVTLYSRAAQVSGELGASQSQLRDFTEAVSLSLQISGTSAEAASGALLQLSQAVGAGTVRAEEFNSILEGAPRLAQAAAQGIEGMGGSVARLRQAVISGEISSREFFEAILSQLPQLQQEFAQTEETAGRALARINTGVLELVDAIDDSTGVSGAWANALNRVAEAIDAAADITRGFGGEVSGLGSVIGALTEAIGNNLTALTAYTSAYETLRNLTREITSNFGQKNFEDIDLSASQAGARIQAQRDLIANSVAGPGFVRGPLPADVLPRGNIPGLVNPYTQTFGGADIFGDIRPAQTGIPRPTPAPAETREWLAAVSRFNQSTEKFGRSVDALDAPVPKPRPSLEERFVAGGGTFGTAPELDFSRQSPFELRDPDRSFALNDEMISRLEDGQQAYVELEESNAAFEQAALNTAGILSQSFGDFFTDLVLEGRGSVEDLMKELQRLILRMLIALAIQRALSSAFNAFGGGAGAQAGQPAPAGTYGSFSGNAVGVAHQGGTVGRDKFPMRYVHPAVFDDAPRFHRGGIVPGEVPIIAQAGETILPRGAKPTVNVNVVNNSRAQVETRQQSNGDIMVMIRDMVRSTVSSDMMRQGTEINRAMQSANTTTRR